MDKNGMVGKVAQFVRFGLVGLSNTLISLLIYYLLIGLQVNYLLATIAGYVISSLSGYILNKLWVFRDKKKVKTSMFRYYAVYISSLLLNTVLMYLWVDIFGISEQIAPILTLCVTVPYNFVFSKLWTFKSR